MSETARELLAGPNVAVLATLRADGSPHTTAVWTEAEPPHVLVATKSDTVKAKNVTADPRVGLTVFDSKDPYLELNLSGRVVGTEPGRPVIDRLSAVYYGETPYPLYREGDEWIALQIEIERWRTNR